MTLSETRRQIMEDDAFVLAEVARLQALYALKHEIRYARQRPEADTESVAEHIFGMLILIEYFLPLEDEAGDWRGPDIRRMALFHDIDEIETGDMLGYLKTDADRAREEGATLRVIARLPDSLQIEARRLLEEYQARESLESRFVKAVDALEPLFHLYNPVGKATLLQNGTTYEDSRRIKDHHIQPFPYLRRFYLLLQETMRAEGFFAPESARIEA